MARAVPPVEQPAAEREAAEAVRDLFPGVKVAIGPAIEAGFYYDFGVPEPFTPEDLAKIEARMAELTARDEPFRRDEVNREQAIVRNEVKILNLSL